MSDIDLNKILKTNDIETLKSYGSFNEVKTFIEEDIKFKLGVKSWNNLLEKIQVLENGFLNNLPLIQNIIKNSSFNKAKKELSEIIHIKIRIQKKKDFIEGINNLIKSFSTFDPFKVFEDRKLENFKNSSKLEGLKIQYQEETLEEIIKKYTEEVKYG